MKSHPTRPELGGTGQAERQELIARSQVCRTRKGDLVEYGGHHLLMLGPFAPPPVGAIGPPDKIQGVGLSVSLSFIGNLFSKHVLSTFS